MLKRPAAAVVVSVLASSMAMLSACGDCPPSKVVPAREESTEIRTYVLHTDGTVTETVAGSTAFSFGCDAACLAAFQDPSMSCQSACKELTRVQDISDCEFNGDRTELRCDLHFAAQEERCNCSMFDC